jgi:hypothetical protein
VTRATRVQAGILDAVTENAFVLAAKLGTNEHNCFPECQGGGTARELLESLHAVTIAAAQTPSAGPAHAAISSAHAWYCEQH